MIGPTGIGGVRRTPRGGGASRILLLPGPEEVRLTGTRRRWTAGWTTPARAGREPVFFKLDAAQDARIHKRPRKCEVALGACLTLMQLRGRPTPSRFRRSFARQGDYVMKR